MIKQIKTIDMSLLYLYKRKRQVSPDMIKKYIKLLNKTCADILEINTYALSLFDISKVKAEFALRIENEKDLLKASEKNITHLICPSGNLYINWPLSLLEEKKIIFETDIKSNKNLELFNSCITKPSEHIDIIRIKGIATFSRKYFERLLELKKLNPRINIDLCAGNKYYCATALSYEACKYGFYSISGTFTGFGPLGGHTPIEELIMAVSVIDNIATGHDTKYFSQLAKLYEQVFGSPVSSFKPVIGNKIFECESGIHVDGITKDCKTYEPYPPEIVGLKRKFIRGKHSKKAVQ